MKSLSLFAFCLFILVSATPAQAGFRYLPAGSTVETNSSAVVEGFADQVPLTVALRQVLPRGTVFSVADSVDVQTKVSWKGGQPWRQVLDTALASSGLRATYTNNMVRVDRAASLPTIQATSPASNAPIKLAPPSSINAEAPIKLSPPIVLTPPASATGPVVVSNQPVVQGEVTSLDPDAMRGQTVDVTNGTTVQQMGTTKPSAPLNGTAVRSDNFVVADEFNGQPKSTALAEITSMDADIKAEVAAGVTGPTAAPVTGTLGTLGMMPADDSGTLVPTTAPTVPYGAAAQWEAKPGQMMRDVLLEWGARAGVEVNWQSEYDYPVQASIATSGTFEEAVRTLLYGFRDAKPQPIGRLHKNDQLGQQVLLITVRGAAGEQ